MQVFEAKNMVSPPVIVINGITINGHVLPANYIAAMSFAMILSFCGITAKPHFCTLS